MTKKTFYKKDLHVHLLSDDREKDDTVGPYRKSLLYLVSRALEDWHKTPLVGFANTLDPKLNDKEIWNRNTLSHLKKWQKDSKGMKVYKLDDRKVVTAAQWEKNKISHVIDTIDAAHGSFDNDVNVISKTLSRITGETELQHKVENLRY